jgi:translocation and assembly module TamB
MDETDPLDMPAAPAAPPRGRAMRALVGVATTLLVVALLLGALVGTGWWAAHSPRGSAWLLSVLPGVQVEEPQGSFIGDFSARRVVIPLPGGSDKVTLGDLRWKGLTVERMPSPLWLRIKADSLSAARVDLALAPSQSTEPLKAPADLKSPIELDLRAVHVGELYAAALGEQPIRALDAQVHIGANAGAEHRIDGLALTWDRLQAKGEARIASTAPMTLAASVNLAQQAAATLPAWNASATLAGPLAAPALQATLRASPSDQRPAQALDAHATLRPFAAWPLGDLQASTQALDLSAFASAAPVTALTGQAVATSTAADQPAHVVLDLSNTLAGRWNEGRLPLRSARLEIAGRPDQPSALELRSLDAELGTPKAAAGRLTAQGRWSPDSWTVATALSDVKPSMLDARAPAMQLSGPLTLSSNASTPGTIDVMAELAGQLTELRAARAVRLKLDAGFDPRRVEVRDLQASAGDTQATVTGLLSQPMQGAPWAVRLQAALVDFNPALWWPGREDSPWRGAATRLNGKATVDLVAPAAVAGRPLQEVFAMLRGQASLTVDRSLLVGVPLTGEASLTAAGAQQAVVAAKFDVDGNGLRADGTMGTASTGADDRWNVAIDGAALGRLTPVFRLFQSPGADSTLGGSLSAKATLTGRWPTMATQGQLDANALRVGAVSVQKAQASWTIGTSATAPVEAQATLSQVSLAPPPPGPSRTAQIGAVQASAAQGSTPAVVGPSLESLQLQLKGTARAHTLALRADSKARPPEWAASLQPGSVAADANAHTLATLQAQGGLIDTAGAALAGWRGVIQQIEVRSDAPGTTPLLRSQDLGLEASWAGGPTRVTLQPGRVELLAGAVRWSRIAWQAASGPGAYAQIEADADIEPLRIAPLLARVQPDFGWGGDLTVGGHVKLRSAAGFNADVVIERGSGDLSVTEELGTRALGITDLRFGLSAENGTWSFTQGVAGSTLGVLSGAVVVRTSPQATWPSADAPLQGVLELRVADLGTWGNWVPPGWRLGGALHTSASFGGRFGAPEYTGQVEGTQLSVRNFLQGVNVSEGDVAIHLEGTTARIERFSAKAGNGSVKLEGNASLGEAPKATLKLTADHFQVLGRVDRRIVASGAGQLQLDSKKLAFDGKFDVDEGLIDFTRSDAPTLSSDINVVRAQGVPSPAAAASAAALPTSASTPSIVPTATPTRDVALDLRVTLGDKLRVRGRGIDTGLRGELHITSPGGKMTVDGTVRTAEGTYAAYGQKLTIDRGLITFNGAVDNPRLDIEATRPNIDMRVGVAVSGTAANPRVRLFSEPELSEIDKLSWLVMGRASDGLGRADTALLQRAALALLAGEGGGPTDKITKALGLDEISVRQSEGEVRETVIALGKQISRRWYVGYERGLNATAGSFQLVYRIAQRFTLRAQSGDDNSLDVIWTWRWQ